MKQVQILEMKVVKQTGGIGIGTPDGILQASISISYTKKIIYTCSLKIKGYLEKNI